MFRNIYVSCNKMGFSVLIEFLLGLFGIFIYIVRRARVVMIAAEQLQISEKHGSYINIVSFLIIATILTTVTVSEDIELCFKTALAVSFILYMLLFGITEDLKKCREYILSKLEIKPNSYVYACEYGLLVCLFCIAGCVFISAGNMFLVYLAKECQTLILCFLVVYYNTKYSSRTALYLFFQAAFYSVMFLTGIAIIYFELGTLDISNMQDYLFLYESNGLNVYWIKVGVMFILLSFGFKLGVPPFNNWLLKVFSVTPRLVIYVIAILSKITMFALLFRIQPFLSSLFEYDINLLLLIGAFALIYSSVVGLREYNIFRIYAYSSFNHIGLLLLGLSINSIAGVIAGIFYFAVYIVNSLFFLVLSFYKRNLVNVLSLSHHFYVDPWYSFVFCALLFSMSGIPPLTGFFSKMLVGFMLYKNAGLLFFIIFVITSSLVLVLYLRIVRIVMFGGYKQLKFYNYSFQSSDGNINMYVLYACLIFNIICILNLQPSNFYHIIFT